MSDPQEQRLEELERRLAHYERMAEDLSRVVADQGREIEVLTIQVRHLAARLREAGEGWERSPQDDRPPPHY
jgi:SlyX protein